MAGSPFHRLFHFGAVGTMSDAQLLERFASRRDEAAEAAFEELVTRHGPMVLRVCRGVLGDAHDAEDAFQATFLVLASRAGSIRRSGSVASWLFGVAQRVSSRARRGAARRRRLSRVVAAQLSEGTPPADPGLDPAPLHEEIDGLPERLRVPVVLCYLQGLTYAAAARQLGLSEVAVRGRLARARERLRHRLTRRGVMVPAGLLVADAAGQAQAAVPLPLVQGTVHIAMGFVTGQAAAVLARGVLSSMLIGRVKVAAAILFLILGAGLGAWHTFAGAAGQDRPGRDATPPTRPPTPALSEPTLPQTYTCPITVTGRALDPDGRPIAGARVYLASLAADWRRVAETPSDSEGRYAFREVELPIERPARNDRAARDTGSFQVFGQAEGFGFAWRPQKWFYPLPKPPNITYEPDRGESPTRYEANDPIILDLRFSPAASLSGRVVDDRGKPLAGVRLEIRDCESLGAADNVVGPTFPALNERGSAPPSMKIRTTGGDGRFEFAGLPANCRFRIDVRAEGFPGRWVHAATTGGPQPDHDGGPVYTGDFTLTLRTPVDVPVRVTLGDTGKPAPGVAVQAVDGLVSILETTDDQGRATLRLPPGTYRMENLPALGTPYLVTEGRLAVEAKPSERPVELAMRPAAVVEVTVADAETGAGLSGVDFWEQAGPGGLREKVVVSAWEAATRIAWRDSPRTDVRGKLRAAVEPGKHRFGVGWLSFPPGYSTADGPGREVECRAGETVRLRFAMRRR